MPNPILQALLALARNISYPDLVAPAPLQVNEGPIPAPLPRDPNNDPTGFRQDGSEKGQGFLGPMTRPDGGVMSEFSIADSENPLLHSGSNYTDYPTFVPTLTNDEISLLLNIGPEGTIPEAIKNKAEAYALERIKLGKPLFARTGERPYQPNRGRVRRRQP